MPTPANNIGQNGWREDQQGNFTYGSLHGSAAGTFTTEAILSAVNNDNNVFDDWFRPRDKEMRQQGYQMMQDYASYQNKMAGMRAAGINPLTAASGLAGSSPSYPASPASSVNPIGDVAGVANVAASGFNSIAGGISTLGKLGSEIDNINADTSKKLSDIGLTNAQTQGVLTDNKYKDDDWKASLNVKRQQFENMKAEWSNLTAQHDEILKHIDEMQSQIELNGSQADYLDSFKLKLDEETRWLKAKNDFCIGHNLYLLESGLDGYIFSMVESGADLTQFDRFVDVYSDYRNKVSYYSKLGEYKADKETIYDRKFNEFKAKYDNDVEFKPFIDFLDEMKEIEMMLIDNDLDSPSTWDAILGKYSDMFSTVKSAYRVGSNKFRNDIKKPQSGPR